MFFEKDFWAICQRAASLIESNRLESQERRMEARYISPLRCPSDIRPIIFSYL